MGLEPVDHLRVEVFNDGFLNFVPAVVGEKSIGIIKELYVGNRGVPHFTVPTGDLHAVVIPVAAASNVSREYPALINPLAYPFVDEVGADLR